MSVKVVIVDDEPLARERIRELLAGRDELRVVGEGRDGEEALRVIREVSPDLVFLDVQMPGVDGFELLSLLEPAETPAVVFVTAYDDFAVRAFEVNALDYLVKPFNRARFDAALARALSRLRAPEPKQLRAVMRPLTRFVVRSGEAISFVRPADVTWLESAGNYVRLHTAGGSHLMRGTIRDVEERLDPEQFVRVHRSTIVNLDAIDKLEPHFHGEFVITLRDGTRVTSSRTYSGRLREVLGVRRP